MSEFNLMNDENMNNEMNDEHTDSEIRKMTAKTKIFIALIVVFTVFLLVRCFVKSPDFVYVVISEAEKTMGVAAFNGGATSITIPETKDGYTIIAVLGDLIRIGDYNSRESLTVKVPDTVKYITQQSKDVKFIVNKTNPYISISDRLLFNKDKTELITCLYLEDTYYRDYYNDRAKDPYFNDDFYQDKYNEYKEINSIKIPDTVTKISDKFKICAGFHNIEVSENNPSFSAEKGALYNKDKTILIKGFGDYIEINSNVKKIEDYAFKNCGFSTISIPLGVEEIGISAFESCSNLAGINIPDSVAAIGINAFSGCGKLVNVEISRKIGEIKSCMFANCILLNSINIPAGVKNIDKSAFYGCNNLNGVKVDSANPRYYFDDGLLWDLEQSDIVHATPNPKREINIPYGVTILRDALFNDGYSSYSKNSDDTIYFERIRKINIPNSVTKIEYRAFAFLKDLSEVVIPASVTDIDWDFANLPDIIFHVESGSYAEQYAKENNIKYEINNSYFSQYSVRFGNPNIEGYTVDIILSVIPKEYKPGDTAVFSLGQYSANMQYSGNSFTGVITVPFTEGEYGKPKITMTSGDITYDEEIKRPVSMREYLGEYFNNITGFEGTYEVETRILDEESGQMSGLVSRMYSISFDAGNLDIESSRIFTVRYGKEDFDHPVNGYELGFGYITDPDKSEPCLSYFEVIDKNGFIYRWFLGESADPNDMTIREESGELSHGIIYDITGTKIIYSF